MPYSIVLFVCRHLRLFRACGSISILSLTVVAACGGASGDGARSDSRVTGDEGDVSQPVKLSYYDGVDQVNGVTMMRVVGNAAQGVLHYGQLIGDSIAIWAAEKSYAFSLPCTNRGSGMGEWRDTNDNQDLDAGDQMILAWSYCSNPAVGGALEGVIRIDLMDGTLDTDAAQTTLQMSVSMQDLYLRDGLSPTQTVGRLHVIHEETLGQVSISVSSAQGSLRIIDAELEIHVADFTATKTLNTENYGYTFNYAGRLEFPDPGQHLNFATDIPFHGFVEAAPQGGQLSLYGRDGSVARLIASDSTEEAGDFRADYDADGRDETLSTIAWWELVEGLMGQAVSKLLNGNPDVPAKLLRLPAEAHDIAILGEGYVSLPDLGQVLEFDPDSMKLVQRHDVGAQPRGLDVGSGSLWIARKGGLTRLLLNAKFQAHIELTDLWGNDNGWDVAHLSNGQVVLSSEPDLGQPHYLATVSIENNEIIGAQRTMPEYSFDGAIRFGRARLAHTQADQTTLHALSFDDAGPRYMLLGSIPPAAGTEAETFIQVNRRIVTGSGQIFNDVDLELLGNLEGGAMAYSPYIYVSRGKTILIYGLDPMGTPQLKGRIHHNCPSGTDVHMITHRESLTDYLYLLRDDMVCRIPIPNQ